MLDLAAPCLGKKQTHRAIRRTREISRLTSRLRDLDVAIEHFSRNPKLSRAIPILQRRRRTLWRRRRRELPALAPSLPGERRIESLKKCHAKLARRYERKLQRLRTRLLAPIPDSSAWPLSQQHAFRRTVRRLRYLRELGLSRRELPDDPVCQILIRTQDTIGELLDEAVCRAETAVPPATVGRAQRRLPPVVEKLQSILARWNVSRTP